MTSKPQCLPIQPEPRTSNTCCRSQNDPSIGNHLPALRHREVGRYADRCVPVFLHLHGLRGDAAAEVRRLLRVLFIRLRSLPSDPSRAFGGNRCAALLRWIIIVATDAVGLAAEPPNRCIGVVACSGRHRPRAVDPGADSNLHLDRCAHLDGNGVHIECKAVRTHALPLHRAILSCNDRTGPRAW